METARRVQNIYLQRKTLTNNLVNYVSLWSGLEKVDAGGGWTGRTSERWKTCCLCDGLPFGVGRGL